MLFRRSLPALFLLTLACGDDGGDSTATQGDPVTGTDASSTGAPTTDAPTTATSGDPSGDPGTTPSTDPTTSSTDPTTSSTDPDTSSTDPTTDTDPGTSTGDELDCAAVSPGPFAPALWISGYDGSEDLAFDGQGGLALKRGGEVVVVAADASETVLATDIPAAYGTRYLADGRLLVALPQAGEVMVIDAEGTTATFLDQVQGPNGIYPDTAGDVWITEFGGARVLRVAPDLTRTTIVMGPDAGAANGVVFDPQRGLLFYTNYQAGLIRRVAIDRPGAPEQVAEIDGAPDGLALDACGNLYVVDQGNSALYRVLLDGAGAASEPPALLAEFPSNVANAQFGAGAGFDPRTLYLAGNPGDVYTLELEFPGAATAVSL